MKVPVGRGYPPVTMSHSKGPSCLCKRVRDSPSWAEKGTLKAHVMFRNHNTMNFAALATCFWLTLQVTTFGVHMAEHLLGLQLCPWACTDVPMGDLFTSTPESISTNPTISAVWIASTYAGHGSPCLQSILA